MIPYDELDRALARWKARAQGGAVAEPPALYESAAVVMDAVEAAPDDMGEPTPLPIPAEELGSIPNAAAPYPIEGTGEIDVNELETYDDDPKRN